jgi:hypothetical protein
MTCFVAAPSIKSLDDLFPVDFTPIQKKLFYLPRWKNTVESLQVKCLRVVIKHIDAFTNGSIPANYDILANKKPKQNANKLDDDHDDVIDEIKK